MEEVVKALLEQNRELTAQIIELAKEALNSRVPAPIPNVPIQTAKFYPAMSESEEDLEFAFKVGAIDADTYKDRKKEFEFLNSVDSVVPVSS